MIHLLLAVIYLSFISLGLPDALLGSAWPVMYGELLVPVSYAGVVSMIIAAGTVLSSLMSDRVTRKWGPGLVTAISVAVTAVALLGFSFSHSFWLLCLWAVPYGLGAGGVDAAVNNYVALHYASRHMSWLHCMWGIGAAAGPYVMGYALTGGYGWNFGYRSIGVFQIVLTAILFCSLPLWKKFHAEDAEMTEERPLSLRQVLKLPGVMAAMAAMFCYSAIEQTTGLWASSYLALSRGVDAETAAFYGSLSYIGITAGRGLCGFLTMKLNDTQMIRLGELLMALGAAALLLPAGDTVALAGLVLVGLGCAPVFPSILHATPAHFGADKSQAIIGVEMASSYVGTSLTPALFGLLANGIGVELLPAYLLLFLMCMTWAYQRVVKACE